VASIRAGGRVGVRPLLGRMTVGRLCGSFSCLAASDASEPKEPCLYCERDSM
jgi:hypothetical protein